MFVVIAYKKKKKLDTGTVVYEYTDKEKAKRKAKKARHVTTAFKNIDKIKSQFEKDLNDSNATTRFTALAVALIYHSYERVGDRTNIGTGVTSLKKKHITISGSKVHLKYVGKSHMKQDKEFSDSKVAKALKEAIKDKGDNSFIFDYEGDDGSDITAKEVNAYLGRFSVTAKDLRAHAANDLIMEELKGKPKPPAGSTDAEKTKHYKAQLKEAIEAVAEMVGHTPGICRSSYIDPRIISQYEKDGTVYKIKKSMALCIGMIKQ